MPARPLSTLAPLALAAAALLASCGQPPPEEKPPRLVRVTEVAPFDNSIAQSFPGLAAATQEINLSFRIDGPLIERPAYTGMEVEEGELLARIDPQDFALTVESIEGQLLRQQASLRRSEADYRRMTNIQNDDPGATSQAAVDRAREAYDSDVAIVQSLEADLAVAQNHLDYTELYAPFTGRVVATYVENFQDVAAKEKVIRLLDTTKIEFHMSVPEQSMPLLKGDNTLTVTFDQYPTMPLTATIKELGTEAQIVTRTYPVTLIMEPMEGMVLYAGMAGKAVIDAKVECEGGCNVQIPASAIVSDQRGNTYVWVVGKHDQEVRKRYVTIGPLEDNGIAITEGIEPGEKVVTAGAHFVKEGETVQIMGSTR